MRTLITVVILVIASSVHALPCVPLLKLDVTNANPRISELDIRARGIGKREFDEHVASGRFRKFTRGTIRIGDERYEIGYATQTPNSVEPGFQARQFLALSRDGLQYSLTPLFDWDRSKPEPIASGEIYYNGTDTVVIHYLSYKTKMVSASTLDTKSFDNYLVVRITPRN